MTQREAAAFHEAGHVVARFWLSLPVPPLVTIDGGGFGETHGSGLVVRLSAHGQAVLSLAGPVAEHRWAGRQYVWDDEGGTAMFEEDELDDLGDSGTIIRLIRDHRVNVEHALFEVHMGLDRFWPQVEAIAALLVADGQVTADQLRWANGRPT